LYSYELRVPIGHSVAREQRIQNKEDAEEVIKAEIDNGSVILGENYYVVNRGNEANPIWWVEWWKYVGSHEETRYPNRHLAFFSWFCEIPIFVFLIFVFSVSWKLRHTEIMKMKSYSRTKSTN